MSRKTIKTDAAPQVSPAIALHATGIEALRAHRKSDSKDIEAVLKQTNLRFGFTEKTATAMVDAGIDADTLRALFALPQKQVKRAVQFVNAVASKDYKSIDATSATALYALHLSPDGALSFDTLHYAIAGVARAEGAAGDSKGISIMRLRKLFSRVGANSVSSQKSRSFGDNGFCDFLGMTSAPKGKVDRVVSINRAHPLCVALVRMIETATDGQIEEMTGEGE